MIDKSKFCKKLRALRKMNKLSVNEVANLFCDYGYPIYFKTIYKWENGTTMPDLKCLSMLCHIYNVNLNDVLNEERAKKHHLSIKEVEFINMIEEKINFKKALMNITLDERRKHL